MRAGIKSVLAAALLSGVATLSASAAMIITSVRTPGTNGNLGNDIIKFYAKFDSTASPEALAGAIGLQSVKATLTTTDSNGFVFRLVDLDGSPADPDTGIAENNDADYQLTKTPKNTVRTSVSTLLGTTVRAWDFNNAAAGGALPTDADFVVTAVDPAGNKNPNPGPPPAYTNLKSFRVEGAILNPAGGGVQRVGADTHASVSNAALSAPDAGAIFAVAVVKSGAPVTATYSLAADQGLTTDGVLTDTGVPEPATVGLMSVAAIGMLARRRRNA